MPRHPNRFQAAFTRHTVKVEIEEALRYRIEQYRARLVERFERRGHSDLTNLTFEEALTDALDVGLEYDEALEGFAADVIDGHLFKSTHENKSLPRLLQKLSDHGRCDIRGESVDTVMKLLAGLDPSATVLVEAGELRVDPPHQPQENF